MVGVRWFQLPGRPGSGVCLAPSAEVSVGQDRRGPPWPRLQVSAVAAGAVLGGKGCWGPPDLFFLPWSVLWPWGTLLAMGLALECPCRSSGN